ncbi:MAG: hypothetical protein E3J86_12715 [Candidatus Thorarchaeota archaeon]|nr:MAG: hypothetical protein E3J86_12715 [Candidatus Thorarchaeota archaeon]
MSDVDEWWNSNQVKQVIRKNAIDAADNLLALGFGIESHTLYSEASLSLGPKGYDIDKTIILMGPGDHSVFRRIPYVVKALVVLNSVNLGNIYFMFEGYASELFHGSELNPYSGKKSAMGILAADLYSSPVQQWRSKKISLMRFTTIETGMFLTHPVPRGVGYAVTKMGDTEWRIFGNHGEPRGVNSENPLFLLLKLEFQKEKSHLKSNFDSMQYPKYIQVNPRGRQSIISVGSEISELGIRDIVSTDLTDFGNQSFLAVAPMHSVMKLNFDVLMRFADISRAASTEYEVYSGVLDTSDSLPRYLAIELERLQNNPDEEPINMSEFFEPVQDSRGQEILSSMKESDPRVLWPQRLKCTNCKAVYKYQASDSQIGKVQCNNCLKYFPANQV